MDTCLVSAEKKSDEGGYHELELPTSELAGGDHIGTPAMWPDLLGCLSYLGLQRLCCMHVPSPLPLLQRMACGGWSGQCWSFPTLP